MVLSSSSPWNASSSTMIRVGASSTSARSCSSVGLTCSFRYANTAISPSRSRTSRTSRPPT
ncbi:hypothetical protein ACFPRL_34790 [Pseudoclavibacter helvolus]